jgi:hypothetical protein
MTDSDRDAEIKGLSPTCLEGESLAGEMTTRDQSARDFSGESIFLKEIL